MNHPRKFPTWLSTLALNSALATVATASMMTTGIIPAVQAALEESPKTVVDEVWQIVNNEFVGIGAEFDPEDWQATRQDLLAQNYSSSQDAYTAIRKALKGLNDPYTRFLDPGEYAQLTNQTSGELSGVGLQLTVDEETSALEVIRPIPDSPAAAAGIEAGDRILRINDRPTSLMDVEDAVKLLGGEEGSTVRLQLVRPSQGLYEVELVRAQIEVPVLHYALHEESDLQIGYMRLDEFSSHAAEQMSTAIEELESQGIDGFVLDLRGNPGGLLFASVDIARMWLETGDIVRTVDRRGGDRQYSANRTSITDSPLVVLIDGYSASASEILAGALKDNNRATLVGSRTYGKGTVQSVHQLSDDSGLAVTISRYFPPSGININKHGIAPDVVYDLSREQYRLLRTNPSLQGTDRDPQYQRAIATLQEQLLGRVIVPALPEPITLNSDR
ncbi:MAG: PDZ domain-containing protein [Spirulina sp. SIO3F2]|nr:PDZ domain-containing protein [Spirulina sp. SIO3F2]